MRIIDENLLNALLNCRQSYPSTRAMALHLGISPSQLGRILRRSVSHLDDSTWKRISPLLAPYIESNATCANCKGCPKSGDCDFESIMDEILSVPKKHRPEWFNALDIFVQKNRKKYL